MPVTGGIDQFSFQGDLFLFLLLQPADARFLLSMDMAGVEMADKVVIQGTIDEKGGSKLVHINSIKKVK